VLRIKQSVLGIVIPLFCFVSTVSTGANFARAENLKDILPALLKSHDLIKAAELDVVGADEGVSVAKGGWVPTLSVTGFYGREKINKPSGSDNTDMVARDLEFSVTQLLWDFGLVNASIKSAKLTKEINVLTLEITKQDLLIRAITAYLNVRRSAEVLQFAVNSVANIKKQAELEDALVKRGAGMSTDVLQAKIQLAGAEARRVQSEGALEVTRNSYEAVFGTPPGDASKLELPVLQISKIPVTLKDSIDVALKENPRIVAANLGSRIATEQIKVVRGGFMPRLDAVVESKYKNDNGGTVGHQQETIGKLTLNWTINTGLTALNSIRAAESGAQAVLKRVGEQQRLIVEQVRNSWQNLRTAKENSVLLTNQANIASEFLDLARKERKLGNRSLIDVLAGETALINANSDAASAKTDVAVATFNLLAAMGRLDLNSIQ